MRGSCAGTDAAAFERILWHACRCWCRMVRHLPICPCAASALHLPCMHRVEAAERTAAGCSVAALRRRQRRSKQKQAPQAAVTCVWTGPWRLKKQTLPACGHVRTADASKHAASGAERRGRPATWCRPSAMLPPPLQTQCWAAGCCCYTANVSCRSVAPPVVPCRCACLCSPAPASEGLPACRCAA